MIIQLVRESGVYKLEEVHHLLSARPAEAFRLTDRGTLETGKAADLLIYDFEKLDYTFGRYEIGRDLPGGEWRRLTPARGINYIVVNGEVTFHDAVCSGATPGRVLRAAQQQDAALRPQAVLQPAE
jgi:N-acyl-D-aspartate/D-glutamate deacylase